MFKKNQLVRVDNKGKARKVLAIRLASPLSDNLESIGCKDGDPIALLSGSAGGKVFSMARLSAVDSE